MKFLVLTSPSTTPCGVEAFARQLSSTLNTFGEHHSEMLPVGKGDKDMSRTWAALRGKDMLLVNLPVVAWKKALLLPMITLIMARLRGATPATILHEWGDLDWKRRFIYVFYLLFTHTVLFSSPMVKMSFAKSWVARVFPLQLGLVPIPPNLRRSSDLDATPLAEKMEKLHEQKKFIVGHFGSIYPKKQSILILDMVAGLRARGVDAFLVFIGSFVKGSDNLEQNFRARITELGLERHVLISGYVETDAQVFALFDKVDAFAYQFAEGLTSRRGSVLATLQSGKPVFVNAPEDVHEFDHHPSFQALLENGALTMVSHEASTEEFVDAITDLNLSRLASINLDFDSAWRDAASAVVKSAKAG